MDQTNDAPMSILDAWAVLTTGGRVARAEWSESGRFLTLVKHWNGNFSGGRLPPTWLAEPFVAIGDARGAMSPWQPSQADIFTRDWLYVPS